jgi:hypothetical protein
MDKKRKIEDIQPMIQEAVLKIYQDNGVFDDDEGSECLHPRLIKKELNEKGFYFNYCKECNYTSDVIYPDEGFTNIRKTELDELAYILFNYEKDIEINKIKMELKYDKYLKQPLLNKINELRVNKENILNEINNLPCNHPNRYVRYYTPKGYYNRDTYKECVVCKYNRYES